jgi:hypothetical protein
MSEFTYTLCARDDPLPVSKVFHTYLDLHYSSHPTHSRWHCFLLHYEKKSLPHAPTTFTQPPASTTFPSVMVDKLVMVAAMTGLYLCTDHTSSSTLRASPQMYLHQFSPFPKSFLAKFGNFLIWGGSKGRGRNMTSCLNSHRI